jgi:hypothetical protein
MSSTMTLKRVLTLLIVLTISGSGVLFAQTQTEAEPVDPDSPEFGRFVQALADVEQIQDDVSGEIDGILNTFSGGEEGFMELHQRVQAAGGAPPANVEDEVVEEYQEIVEEVDEVQMASQQEMIDLVQDRGLSVSRFNEIIVMVQQDSELQQAIQERR